jgi:pimeloyl-ACP methyl ester carboxylesterase
VHAAIAKRLDWFSIQLAKRSVQEGAGLDAQVAAAETLLHDRKFFADFVRAPEDLRFTYKHVFRFTSPVASRWSRNNVVHGRFLPCRRHWRPYPTVLMLHGWNAEIGYRTLFPYLARRLNLARVNAMMFELPYHSQRKPRGDGAIRNFIADDLLHVVHAAHQSIADARALVAWLHAQGCRQVGVWGISLGAWLAGLLACVEPHLQLAVLMTPVVRMDRVIAELDFCQPIRRALQGSRVHLEPLNLASHRPKVAPENILMIASEHDLFAPIETNVELAGIWKGVELWRPLHGHISVLMSAPVMERTVRWITGRTPPRATA